MIRWTGLAPWVFEFPFRQVDIYTNYDCDVQCTNLFEDMCRFLSKNAFPLSGYPSAPKPQTPKAVSYQRGTPCMAGR